MKHIRINPWLFAVIGIACFTKSLSAFCITYASLLFHELIHLFFLSFEKVLIHQIVLEPFGICIETENDPPQTAAVYLWAPVGNLLVAFCLWLGAKNGWIPLYSQWFFSNLFLGSINLLPCLPLDGGRALLLLLQKHLKEPAARKFMKRLSLILSASLIIAGVLLFQKSGQNVSLFLIGIFLCYTCLTENRLNCQKSICNALYRMEMGDPNTTLPIVSLVASRDYPARKIIAQFQGECYYTVTLLSHGKIMKTLTETQILNQILHSDANLLLSECG